MSIRSMIDLRTIAVFLFAGLIFPSAAVAQDAEAETEAATIAETADDEEEEEEEEEDEASKKDWGISAGINTNVGQGTFVDPPNDSEFSDIVDEGDNAYDRVSMSFLLGGSYTYEDFTASLDLAAVQWLTAGGGINDANEFRFQDTSLTFSWAGYKFGETGLSVSANLGLVFPTSDMSQTASLLVGTSLGTGLKWSLFDGDLSLSYGLSGGKDFHEFTSAVLDEEDISIWRDGGAEDLGGGLVAIDGVNAEYFVTNSLGVSMKVVEKLRLSVSYSIATFWSYSIDNDDAATPEGENINTGRNTGQLTRTAITLRYPLEAVSDALGLQSFGLSLAMRTSVQPKTDDNQSFRFPFWNVDGAERNFSQIRFGVSAAY